MKKDVYQINGMGCQMCANKIQNKIANIDGVNMAKVSLEKQQLEVEFQEDLVSKEEFATAIDDLGYELV